MLFWITSAAPLSINTSAPLNRYIPPPACPAMLPSMVMRVFAPETVEDCRLIAKQKTATIHFGCIGHQNCATLDEELVMFNLALLSIKRPHQVLRYFHGQRPFQSQSGACAIHECGATPHSSVQPRNKESITRTCASNSPSLRTSRHPPVQNRLATLNNNVCENQDPSHRTLT